MWLAEAQPSPWVALESWCADPPPGHPHLGVGVGEDAADSAACGWGACHSGSEVEVGCPPFIPEPSAGAERLPPIPLPSQQQGEMSLANPVLL